MARVLRKTFLVTNSALRVPVCCYSTTSRLVEVGRFETPKSQGKYSDGQIFMHKIFGYRGVILFPWDTTVYEHDSNSSSDEPPTRTIGSNVQGKNTTYYQVLIDERDCPFIRAQPEAVTFLGNTTDTSLYTIRGLDYASHEDVLPYISSDRKPIHHDMFNQFIHKSPGEKTFRGTAALHAWHQQYSRWLEISSVYRETTDDIRVTVAPFYMGSRMVNKATSYWWRYAIRLENLGRRSVQLVERHWRIFNLNGALDTVRGKGVVGCEPVLSPSYPAFQYSSHVSLQTKQGQMWGSYRMEYKDGRSIDVRIPPFMLDIKDDAKDEV